MKLDATVASLSFTKCIIKHDLHTQRSEKEDLDASVYVDDLFITGSRPSDIGNFKREMTVLLHN
jgi:hypothetical protein